MKIEKNALKLELEKAQGDAFVKALDLMKQMDNHLEVEVDDYIISLASEEAEGTYQLSKEGLEWKVPEESENAHLEIVVRDKHDNRFIPGLHINARILKEDKVIAEKEFPFYWHPFLYHYGSMLHIPEEGEYYVEVHIAAPDFPRHDEVKGKRYPRAVTKKLGPLKMEKGRKPHGPE